MTASVKLTNINDNIVDDVIINDIEQKECFSYIDNYNDSCEICIYDNGICLFKQSKDYFLELQLRDKKYIKMISEDGIITFDVKVVDFSKNSDILLMHYIVDNEERVIEIKYF